MASSKQQRRRSIAAFTCLIAGIFSNSKAHGLIHSTMSRYSRLAVMTTRNSALRKLTLDPQQQDEPREDSVNQLTQSTSVPKDVTMPPDATPSTSTATVVAKKVEQEDDPMELLRQQQRRNVGVAILSIALAISNYAWQFTHPLTPVQLLATMQQSSEPLTIIGTNPKPTVVDFWAPWCENCKMFAPTLQKVEQEYRGDVNFCMVNGDDPKALPYLDAFGVDAIPHLALVSSDGTVETALIGPIPKSVLKADLDTLIYNAQVKASNNEQELKEQPLPYTMLDVFANRPPELRKVHFDE